MTRRRMVLAGALTVLLLAGVSGWLVQRGGPGGSEAPVGANVASPTASDPGAALPSGVAPGAVTPSPTPGDGAASPGESTAVLITDAGLPPTLEPVALDRPSDYGDGVRARLVGIEAIDVQATGVGEVSGPALAVTVELTNAAAAAVPLDTVTVNLYTGAAALPAAPLQHETAVPFRGALAAAGSARAVYVFAVPLELRDLATVTVGHTPASGTAVFAGSLR